jgi:hypothetical protein
MNLLQSDFGAAADEARELSKIFREISLKNS